MQAIIASQGIALPIQLIKILIKRTIQTVHALLVIFVTIQQLSSHSRVLVILLEQRLEEHPVMIVPLAQPAFSVQQTQIYHTNAQEVIIVQLEVDSPLLASLKATTILLKLVIHLLVSFAMLPLLLVLLIAMDQCPSHL